MLHIIPDLIPTLLLVVPFVVAFLGLRLILWTPLNQYLDDRENATDGARREAEEFSTQAEQRTEAIEQRLHEAHLQIVNLAASARARAQKKEAEIIGAAREAAEGTLSTANQRIADERLKAKAELEATVQTLSTDIVSTLLA